MQNASSSGLTNLGVLDVNDIETGSGSYQCQFANVPALISAKAHADEEVKEVKVFYPRIQIAIDNILKNTGKTRFGFLESSKLHWAFFPDQERHAEMRICSLRYAEMQFVSMTRG